MPKIDKVFSDGSFVPLKDGIKFPPLYKGWQLPENAMTFAEATAHMGNIGVLAGGEYFGLDEDVPEAFKGLDLPITTLWETRPGRLGFRFRCNEDHRGEVLAKYGKKADIAQLKLYKNGNQIGEIKLRATYQVIPPSWKEVDGKRVDYRLLGDSPPAVVSLAWLLSELQRIGITFSSKLESNAAKLEGKIKESRQKRAETDEHRTRRYAEAALKGEVSKLSKTKKGDRNDQLNTSAFNLGQFIPILSESEVIRELSRAARYVGLTQDEIERTIQSGLEAESRHPREIPPEEGKKPNISEDVIPYENIEGNCDIKRLLDICKFWLYIKEDYSIVGPLVAAIANFCPGDPDIIGIIAPSGSTKTEGIRALGEEENQFIYPLSSLSEHTFISGYVDKKGKPGRDLVPLLKHRLLVIKDLTTILAKREDVRSQIFADFRELTDGYIKKEFGNGAVKEYRDVHSSILFACTNAIERYYSMYSNLGQRMIFMRPEGDKIKARTQSVKNRPSLKKMRAEIHNATMQFLQLNVEKAKTKLPTTPEEIAEEMGPMFDFLAIARTSIHHDMKGDIDEIPEPEYPTRIANTLTRLLEVHALIYGRDEVGSEDVAFGVRIIKDNVPTMRLRLLSIMAEAPGVYLTTAMIAGQAELPNPTVKRTLDEMFALHLVDRIGHEEKGKDDEGDRRSDSFMLKNGFLPVIKRLKTMGV